MVDDEGKPAEEEDGKKEVFQSAAWLRRTFSSIRPKTGDEKAKQVERQRQLEEEQAYEEACAEADIDPGVPDMLRPEHLKSEYLQQGSRTFISHSEKESRPGPDQSTGSNNFSSAEPHYMPPQPSLRKREEEQKIQDAMRRKAKLAEQSHAPSNMEQIRSVKVNRSDEIPRGDSETTMYTLPTQDDQAARAMEELVGTSVTQSKFIKHGASGVSLDESEFNMYTGAATIKKKTEDSEGKSAIGVLFRMMPLYILTQDDKNKHLQSRKTRYKKRSGEHKLFTWCHDLKSKRGFTIFFSGLVIVNGIIMAVEVDAREGSVAREIVEIIFCILFGFELLVRLFASDKPVLKRKAFMLDSFVVAISVGDLCLSISTHLGGDREEDFPVQVITVVRLLRLARFTRIFRMIGWLRPVRVVLDVLSGSFGSIFWILVVYSIIFYCFAIALRMLLDGAAAGSPLEVLVDEKFSSVLVSIWTFWEVLLLGTEWTSISKPLIKYGPTLAVAVWFIFIFLAQICLGNLVIAMFIDALIRAAKRGDMDVAKEKLLAEDYDVALLTKILLPHMDKRTGKISKADFITAVNQNVYGNDVLDTERIFGVTHDDIDFFFEELDDSRTGFVSIDDILLGVLEVKAGTKTVDKMTFDSDLHQIAKESQRLNTHMHDLVFTELPRLTAEALKQKKMLDDTLDSHEIDELDVRMDALEATINDLIVELGGPIEPLLNPQSMVSVRLGLDSQALQGAHEYDHALGAALLNVGKMTLSENMSNVRSIIESAVRAAEPNANAASSAAAQAAQIVNRTM